MPTRPSWFRDGEVVMSNAATCGINKDGMQQFTVDALTGARSATEIDDRLGDDVRNILAGKFEAGAIFVRKAPAVLGSRVLVPTYYDDSSVKGFDKLLARLGKN